MAGAAARETSSSTASNTASSGSAMRSRYSAVPCSRAVSAPAGAANSVRTVTIPNVERRTVRVIERPPHRVTQQSSGIRSRARPGRPIGVHAPLGTPRHHAKPAQHSGSRAAREDAFRLAPGGGPAEDVAGAGTEARPSFPDRETLMTPSLHTTGAAPRRASLVPALLVALGLSACASSVGMVNLWKDPDYPKQPMTHVLVVAMKKDAGLRRIWEDGTCSA